MLSQALGAACSCEVLDLSFNLIDAKGVKALRACLRNGAAPKLKKIDLAGNPACATQLEAAMVVTALCEARRGLVVNVSDPVDPVLA